MNVINKNKKIITILCLLVVAIHWPLPGDAQEQAPAGEISAIAYTDLPPGSGFSLEPFESSALTDQVMQRLSRTLPQHHFSIEPRAQARYGLIIDARLIQPDSKYEPPRRLQLLRVPFKYGNEGPAPHEYHISFSVYDHQSGLYVWRGEAARADESQPIDAITDRMIDALVGAIGKNVKQSPIAAP